MNIIYFLFLVALLSLSNNSYSQQSKDTDRIAIIEGLFKSLRTNDTNSEIMKQHTICEDYLTNDTIKDIADGWLDHLRPQVKGNNNFTIRKYNSTSKNIEFGLTNIHTKNILILSSEDIYEFFNNENSSTLFIYLNADNKIVSFAGFEINNRVGLISF